MVGVRPLPPLLLILYSLARLPYISETGTMSAFHQLFSSSLSTVLVCGKCLKGIGWVRMGASRIEAATQRQRAYGRPWVPPPPPPLKLNHRTRPPNPCELFSSKTVVMRTSCRCEAASPNVSDLHILPTLNSDTISFCFTIKPLVVD
jgi:hypothetical protein